MGHTLSSSSYGKNKCLSVTQLRWDPPLERNWLPFIRDEGIFFVSILEVSELRSDFAYLGGFSISLPSRPLAPRANEGAVPAVPHSGRVWLTESPFLCAKERRSGAESPDENCHARRSTSRSSRCRRREAITMHTQGKFSSPHGFPHSNAEGKR